jgi:hypothetical protein
VDRVFVGHGSHDGESIGDPGDLREPFRNLQPRDNGINGAQFALNFSSGLGLGIEGFVLWRRAEEKHEDAGFRAALSGVTVRDAGGCGVSGSGGAAAEPKGTHATDLEQISASDTAAQPLAASG